MSAPNIYAYYGNVPDLDRTAEQKLQMLWRQHWQEAGFNPRILSERDAIRHPGYYEYIDIMAKLPTINPKGYDLCCYSRWVAVAQVIKESGAPYAFMSDYDLYPNFRTWADVEALIKLLTTENEDPEKVEHHLVCYSKCVPCFVGGRHEDFAMQCARFAKYAPTASDTHLSDMHLLEKQAESDPTSYRHLDIGKLWSEPGWEKAPVIHFANAVCGPANKLPRHEHIPTILESIRVC